MKLRTLSFLLAGLSLSFTAAAIPIGTNLIINGSFEDTRIASGGMRILNSVNGWGTTNQIELRNNLAGRASDGVVFAELAPHAKSSIFQTIDYTGRVRLSFDYAARPGHARPTSEFTVSFGNVLNQNLLTNVFNANNQNLWLTYSQEFDLSGSNQLKFTALPVGAPSLGASLDNIRVVTVAQVPEPEGYAMLALGMGLMGMMLRRRTKTPQNTAA